jgi:hypothetical protein
MDCRKAQQQLSLPDDPAPDVREHLDSCGDCRRFAGDLGAIRGMIDPAVSTPSLLREQTLDVCRTALAARVNGQTVTASGRLKAAFESPRFVAVTAAVSVLLLATSILIRVFADPVPGSDMILKISITQIVLQNLVAALFTPALLMFRNRLGGRRVTAVQQGD